MAIGPIELQGTIMRTQDFTLMKHQEDQRGVVEQSHFQNELRKEVEGRSNQINAKERPENGQKKFDAREKGSNEYHRQESDAKKKQKQPADGKVVIKRTGGFDISI